MTKKELNVIEARIRIAEKRGRKKPLDKVESIVWQYLNDCKILRLKMFAELNIREDE